MNTNANVQATFVDRYGEERIIHKTKHGLRVKYQKRTTILAFAPAVAKVIGQNIRRKRIERGWSLEELCARTGLSTVTPKARMWEIENCTRDHGVKVPTLYAIAAALECEVADLLPTVKDAMQLAGVRSRPLMVLD